MCIWCQFWSTAPFPDDNNEAALGGDRRSPLDTQLHTGIFCTPEAYVLRPEKDQQIPSCLVKMVDGHGSR